MYIKDEEFVEDYLNESLKIANHQLSYNKKIITVAKNIYEKIQSGGSILICGNGGSASDSQHIAAEFVSRFEIDDVPLPAIALTTDTSVITAIGNDYSFNEIFSRQIDAIGNQGDILICISTSGNSQNIIEASKCARSKGIEVISFIGNNKSELEQYSDYSFKANSKITGIIQQIHITVGQLIAKLCELEFNSN